MEFTDLVGIVGLVAILAGYSMVSLNRWKSADFRFHLLNFIGAVAILISLVNAWNLPTLVMEICWGSISIFGMVKAKWRV